MIGKVDISNFMKDWRRFKNEAVPEAIVRGVARTAERGRDAVRAKTERVFKLHSNYIPKSILSIPNPDRKAQIRAAVRALKGRHKDFTAAVFVRGADIFGQRKQPPDKDLGFMTLHEEGGKKSAYGGGMIAIPARGVKGYSFRTGRGRVKKKWKPAELLKKYNEVGPLIKGSKRRRKRSTKGSAFIMKSKRGRDMIVRRKTRKRYPLEVLYMFFPSSKIRAVWGFVSTVQRETRRHIFSDVERQIKRIR